MDRKQSALGSYPSHWELVVFDTVAELKHGYQFRTHDFTDNGVKVFKITQIKSDGTIDISNCDYIESSRLNDFKKFIIESGDILMALSGATIGKISRFKSNEVVLQNYRVGNFLTKDNNVLQKDYFYYYLTTDYTYQQILANQTQSAQENVGKEDIHKMLVFLPPLTEQERIAEVLSSLDDKIDLLHRNNKTLEQLAETFFRQWFVEEAETKPVKHFGKIICGKTPSKNNSNFFNGPIPFLKIPDMHGKAFVFKTTDSLTEEGKQSQSNKTIPPFSISVSCIATVGLVTINAFECQTNQQINSIVPNEKNYRYYLYNYFKSITDDLIQRASSGSVTHNLNTSDFSNIEIPFFSDDLFSSFDDVVDPLYQKVFINEQQIQQLETLRDTLLPKLMSGVVRVEE